MTLHLEHLAADVLGLNDTVRQAISKGELGSLRLASRLTDIPTPPDHLDLAEREWLASSILEGHRFHELPKRALTSINSLAQAGTFCVLTGQQPGLCASPLYSLYKALQACRLATDLSRSTGRPVVPVFWNHGDDHDIAEVHHAAQLNRNFDVQRIKLAGLSSGRTPLSQIRFDEQTHHLGATRALIADLFEEHPHTPEALDLFFPREGESFTRAFTRTMSALLGHLGLVVVEPDWIRSGLSSALAQIISGDPVPALMESSASWGPGGPPIDPQTAALVYRVTDGQRRALRSCAEGFAFDDEPGSRTACELAAQIASEHAPWSAGALLRPLVQDAVFPTLATIGGYGELQYHAQLGPLRAAAELPSPPFVARVSMTLVEPDLAQALEKLSASAPGCPTNSLTTQVLRSRGRWTPDTANSAATQTTLAERLHDQADRCTQGLKELQGELEDLQANLRGNLQRTIRGVRNSIDKLAQKVERVEANQSGRGARVLRHINHSLCPNHQPQERVLGPLQFCARHGFGWIDELYHELPPLGFEHLLVYLQPAATEKSRPTQ